MKSKSIKILVMLVLVIMVLGACAQPTAAPTTAAPTTAPGTEAKPTEISTGPTSEPLKPGQVEIRWFIGLGTGTDPEQLTAEQEVVDAFNAAHPDIKLVTEIVTYEAAFDTLATELAAGNPPDIVGPMGVDGAESFHGQWLDLDPLIKKNKYDLTQFDQGAVNFYKNRR